MKTEITTAITGGAGVLGTEIAQQIPPETITTVGNLLIQAAIALATIWKLVKDYRANRQKATK